MHGTAIRTDDKAASDRAAKLAAQAADKAEYRRFVKAGGGVLPPIRVPDFNGLIEDLIDLHWLEESESEDPKAIARAVGNLLSDIRAGRSR